MTALYLQFAKYIAVGVLNSAVGLMIIYLGLALGLNDVAANALGYLVGFAISFAINSKWTFKQTRTTSSMFRFLLVTAIAYGGNLITMLATRDILHVDHRLAQLAGVISYTCIGFVGARVYAFRIKRNVTHGLDA
jgi:putative flippase GtrA